MNKNTKYIEAFDEQFGWIDEPDTRFKFVINNVRKWLGPVLDRVRREAYEKGYQTAMKQRFSIKPKEYYLASPYKKRIVAGRKK